MFRSLLAMTLPAALLVAQAGADERPRLGAGDHPGRARIIARLHEIRAQRIQTALGVTEGTAKGIADRWGQFDQDSHERRQGMRQSRQKVQEALVGPGSDQDKNLKIAPLLTQFSNLQKQQKEAKQKFEEDIQRMLTPVQQGRFLILMEEFQRNLAEALPDRHQDR